jgi:hypothetical protein
MGRPAKFKSEVSKQLLDIATKEKIGFGSTYKGLPLQKLQSLKKWSSWAKAEPPRPLQRKAVKFLKDVECCVSGELRFLLEISGKLSEALFSQFHDGYIPPLQKYWDISSHPKGLIEAYTLFKEGKIGGDSYGLLRLSPLCLCFKS